jgi:hypothetical protein
MAKQSASELLSQRGRTTVAPRSDDISEIISKPLESEPDKSVSQPIKSDATDLIGGWKEELEGLPAIANFMLRVEQDIKDELQSYAKKQSVTAETFIQAMWIVLKQNPEQFKVVLAEASKHHYRRSRAAELKNLITRASKIS